MIDAGAGVPSRRVGRRFGKYTLLRRIGRGGMAEVWLARAHGVAQTDRLVALKLVSSHYADDAQFLAMLRQEARIATSLDHPNIAATLEFDVAEGESFLAMEYVHGSSLLEALQAAAKAPVAIPLGCAIGIVRAVCEGLHHAHEACDADGRSLGVVHRDVSPSNVILRHDGVVKVVDFGIAKATTLPGATQSGTLKGKRGYMSPEQCDGLDLDRRSDVFAAGILLYEVTTGFRLFTGRNDFEVMNRIVRGEIEPPSRVREGYPEELERIVLQALSRDRDDRQPTAEELQRQLEAFARELRLDTSTLALRQLLEQLFGARLHPAHELGLEELGTEAPLPEPEPATVAVDPPPSSSPARRRWAKAVAIAATAVGVAALGIAIGRQLQPSTVRADTPSEPAAPGTLEAARVTTDPPPAEAPHVATDPPVDPSPGAEDPRPAAADPSKGGGEGEAALTDPVASAAAPSAEGDAAASEAASAPPRARSRRRSSGRPRSSSSDASPSDASPRRPSGSLFPSTD